jgi:glycosyltransferase involved in cell wall biosynthesis
VAVSGGLRISVVIPTHNRTGSLHETIRTLCDQTLDVSEYEIIVVDDGSTPAIVLDCSESAQRRILIRLEGRERSAARNVGARAARGEVVVFVDDDISVATNFLEMHLCAQNEWPDAIAVGAIRLPGVVMERPFGRFRQALELQGVPEKRGSGCARNFCTAANMSISRKRFVELGGFDELLVTAEDQDLALRHSERGGLIAFVPEAVAVHRDEALDVRGYCRRTEWGSERIVVFCERHQEWPDNIERDRVNGPVRWRREPLGWSVRKILKGVIAVPAVVEVLFGAASILERSAPDSRVLQRVYRLLLGAHVFRGYRRGLARANRAAAEGWSMVAAGPR